MNCSAEIILTAKLAWFVITAAGSTASAQSKPPQPTPASESPAARPQDEQDKKKLTEWPGLKSTASDRVRGLANQFRKPKEELHAEAKRKLIEIGAGAAPILIPLVTDRADNINEHLFAILDSIVTPQHAALLAREVDRHSIEWRRYAMRRLCRFADPDLLPVLEKANQDEDVDVAFCAALGLLAQHRGDGLDKVLLAAKQRWQDVGSMVAEVLPAARSAATANLVFEKIAQARPTDQMAGLRLLRYLMVKDQGVVLRTYLQAADFTVKREAINAARVLHGEAPLEKLASFQAIEMAKEWLDKL